MTQGFATMAQAQIEEFLRAPRYATVATNRADGAPQLSPVWYLYEDARVYIGILADSAKYRNLSRDPSISVCIHAEHPDARAVVIYGKAEIMEDDSEWREDMHWRITRRYYDSDEAARRYRDEIREWGRSALIVVEAEKVLAHDYN
jgi:PPOX class probable F420-dependent enzyme